MLRSARTTVRPVVTIVLAVTLLLALMAGPALAFSGGLHRHATDQACELFTWEMFDVRPDRETPLFPMLLEQGWWFVGCDPGSDDGMWQTNWYWLVENSVEADYYETVYDGYTEDTLTYTHFWEAEEGLREDVEGSYKNAWEKAEILWDRACKNWWSNSGLDGTAFSELGYVIHLMEDMGQPAHVHSDLHGPANRDSLEEACSKEWAEANFQWNNPSIGVSGPQDVMALGSNAAILADIWASGHYNDELNESDPDDGDPQLATEDSLENTQQLFGLFYMVNQTADFFASDGAEGVTDDPIGWMSGYADFPAAWWHLTGDDSDNDWSWDELDNNETGCPLAPENRIKRLCTDDTCDCDGDLSIIALKCYGTAFRAVPALIDLYRRTIDDVPPVTTAEKTREDGEEYKSWWNTSHVDVHLVDAVDHGRQLAWGGELRASGVWRKWGTLDGVRSDDLFNPWWHIEDGVHEVKLLSTDYCGNTENVVFAVYVDTVPPEISFPDLRPNYLTSQSFTPMWDVYDATSGVKESHAEIDGVPVERDVPLDLALEAGQHTLRVYASDIAGNECWKDYEFEVWIDTETDAKSIKLNNKTSGQAMYVMVQFPLPYDVGLIDVTTCRLTVDGVIDLEQELPITQGSATIEGELLTGVGDVNEDGIPDRMIKFDKSQFAAALGGRSGDIQAIAWGGLLPNGTPRFIGEVTVTVFAPPDN